MIASSTAKTFSRLASDSFGFTARYLEPGGCKPTAARAVQAERMQGSPRSRRLTGVLRRQTRVAPPGRLKLMPTSGVPRDDHHDRIDVHRADRGADRSGVGARRADQSRAEQILSANREHGAHTSNARPRNKANNPVPTANRDQRDGDRPAGGVRRTPSDDLPRRAGLPEIARSTISDYY